MDEHYLIHLLKASSSVIRELCFVAELDGEIAGHILYTKSKFRRPDNSEAETITFGPLSVLPKYHRQGIGKALVTHSMEKAREMGFKAVLIVGVPEYYPKLGFKRASEYGLFPAGDYTELHAVETQSLMNDAFMVYELKPGYLSGGVHDDWAPEFDTAENDDAGFDTFHKSFAEKYFPGELTLRLFYENDMALMERRLYADHVAPWYEQPLDWIRELRKRYGEFRFVTHMIAEVDGNPIGFCQYYDCYHSREPEDWGIEIPRPGEIYSIDYLIGEKEYLCRGFGKIMISQMLGKLWELGAEKVIVLPDKENSASNCTLEAVGFHWDGERYVIYRRER